MSATVAKPLEADPAFLTKGGVFSKDFIDFWVDYKMTKEVAPVSTRSIGLSRLPAWQTHRQ
jgi:hypothetical protein